MENRTLLRLLHDGDLVDLVDELPWDERETFTMPDIEGDGKVRTLHLGRFGASLVSWSIGFDEQNVVFHRHDTSAGAAECFHEKVRGLNERLHAAESGQPSLPPQIQRLLDMMRANAGPGVDIQAIPVGPDGDPVLPELPQRKQGQLIGRPPTDDYRAGMYL